MSEHIVVERHGAVQSIRMNRPEKKNALTSAMYAAMAEALKAGEADHAVAVHVLFGVPGAFTAGNDLEDFARAAATGNLGLQVLDFLMALANLEKPIVCGVDGLAIGIGTTALLHADLVYASDRSLFRTPFLDLGLVPEGASSLLAPRLMGHPLAFELLCLGNGFDAPRAASVGMVNRVVGADEVEAGGAALEILEDLGVGGLVAGNVDARHHGPRPAGRTRAERGRRLVAGVDRLDDDAVEGGRLEAVEGNRLQRLGGRLDPVFTAAGRKGLRETLRVGCHRRTPIARDGPGA